MSISAKCCIFWIVQSNRKENAMAALPTFETYNELQTAYDFFNTRLFDGGLPPCLITLQREKRTYGYFSSKRFVGSKSGQMVDEIAMNPSYFAIRSIEETLSTLVHEMAHLWQFHYGKPGRRGYHNKEWGAKMDSIGLCPSNTGAEGGKRTGEKMSHYIVSGGNFERACSELMTDEFNLSWFDRFPPERPTALVFPPTIGKPITPTFVDDEGGKDDGEGGQEDEDLIVLPPTEPVNKSNRIKYRCPCCSAQVWGKPNLLLKCGQPDCGGADFEAVEE